MTAEVHKNFHDSDVTLVDANVQRSLTALVASVQISTTAMKHTNHFRLITKCCVMHGTITVLVLHRQTTNGLEPSVHVVNFANYKPHVIYLATYVRKL